MVLIQDVSADLFMSVIRRKPLELARQCVDPREVGAGVVFAAPLARGESKPAPSVRIARPGTAEMDRGGKMLRLPRRCGGDAAAPEGIGH
ncbi:MAG: hypothetical protein ABSH33_16195, partial [Steroidobacteraceae bacterium]